MPLPSVSAESLAAAPKLPLPAHPTTCARWLRLVAVVLLVAIVLGVSGQLLWRYPEVPQLFFLPDAAVYMASAQSLADGEGYRNAHLPGAPYQTKYPPLFSGLLALTWLAFDEPAATLTAAAVLTWFTLVLFLAGSYAMLCRLGLRRVEALLLTAFLGLHPDVVFLSAGPMADLLGAAVVLWCLVLIGSERTPRGASRQTCHDGSHAVSSSTVEAAGDGAGTAGATAGVASLATCSTSVSQKPLTTWRAAVGGLVAGLGYLVKTVAFPLAGAVPLWLLWRRRWRPAVAFVAVFVPVATAWTVWGRMHMTPTDDPTLLYYTNYPGYYLTMVGDGNLPTFIWRNVWFLAAAIGDLVFRGMSENPAGAMIARIVAVLALAGIVRLARRRGLDAYHLYALGTGAIFLIWHFPTTVRFLLPVAPLLLAGVYVELRNVTGTLLGSLKKPALGERILAGAIGAVLVAAVPVTVGHHLRTDLIEFPALLDQVREIEADREKVTAWIADHVPDSAAIYAYDDAMLYLATGHKAMKVSLSTRGVYLDGPDEFLEPFQEFDRFLSRHGLDYALVCESDFSLDMPENLRPAARDLIRQTAGLTEVYASEFCTLHRYTPSDVARLK